MTIVLDSHAVITAFVASTLAAFFFTGFIWLTAYSLRGIRQKEKKQRRRAMRGVAVGMAATIFWLLFGIGWWRDWSPWAVTFTDSAVHLKYLLSTQRIDLADVERVEFELVEQRRGRRERSIARLSSDGRVYMITQDPEPAGALSQRPVRQVFDQLATRLPRHKVHEVTRHRSQ